MNSSDRAMTGSGQPIGPASSQAIIQNGWVVGDLQQAMHGWLKIGVGPFLYFDVDIPDAHYRGRKAGLHGHFALAQAGPVQIELIEPRGDAPSAYLDLVPQGQTGFHHIMKTCLDWQREMAAFRNMGVAIATEASHNGIRFAYIDTRAELGCMTELVEDGPLIRAINEAVRKAADNWDGRDPIRPLTID